MDIWQLRQQNKIKIHGRYTVDDGVRFDNVASGIEVRFTGSKLFVTMKTFARPKINPLYDMFTVLCVMVDGNDPLQMRLDVMSDVPQRYEVVSLPYGTHTVKLFKTDDPLISSWTVSEVETDGTLNVLPMSSKLRLELFGDSISVGGDNLIGDGPSLDVVPGTGNGCATFATFCAYDLDADINVLARCGLCLYPASTSDTEVVVGKIYDKVSALTLAPWDMSAYVPDAVIISLGTNDELGNVFDTDGFSQALVTLANDLVRTYCKKDILFVLTYGFMDKTEQIRQGVISATESLCAQGIKAVNLQMPHAKCGHPSVAEHRTASHLLTELIRNNI